MADREHRVVVGASGRRMGCRVCRIGNRLANLEANPKWKEPCNPTVKALAQFEKAARERIAEATEDLAHAASLRLTAEQAKDAEIAERDALLRECGEWFVANGCGRDLPDRIDTILNKRERDNATG